MGSTAVETLRGSWQIAVTYDPPAVPGIQEKHRPAALFQRNLTLGTLLCLWR